MTLREDVEALDVRVAELESKVDGDDLCDPPAQSLHDCVSDGDLDDLRRDLEGQMDDLLEQIVGLVGLKVEKMDALEALHAALGEESITVTP